MTAGAGSNYKMAAVAGLLIFVVAAVLSLVVYNLIPSTRNGVNPPGRSDMSSPDSGGIDHYINLWTTTNFPVWFKNTLIIGVAAALVQTLIIVKFFNAAIFAMMKLMHSGDKYWRWAR